MAITTAMRTQVTQLYVSLFGRAPESDGLGYWVGQLNAGQTFAQIADAMYAVAPARAVYPSYLTNQEIIGKFYTNVLGRTADADGLTYWTAQLDAKGATPGSVIAQMINVVANYAGSDAAGIKSANLFNNKVNVGLYYAVTTGGNNAANTALNGVDDTATSVTAAKAVIDGTAAVGQTFTLTTGVDAVAGSTGNDTINGTLAAVGTGTLSALDGIDGGAGSDTLSLTDITAGTALPAGLAVKNVETLNLRAANAATIDTSTGFTGLTQVTVSQSAGADVVTVGKGTAVSVTNTLTGGAVSITAADSGVTATAAGTVTAVGGSTQTVTTAGGYALSKATGAITVTDTAQAAVNSTVDGGTTVTVTSTATNPGSNTGKITVGGAAAPSGAVSITSNLTNKAAAASNTTGGNIAVTGGTTVAVTQTAAQAVMATASTNSKVVQADVAVTSGASTSSVTVTQAPAVAAASTALAVAGVSEVDTVQFVALPATKTVTIAGLTVTAPTGGQGLTAKQVAAAFANLADGQLTGWSSSAVSGTGADTVTFSQTAVGGGTITPTTTGSAVTTTSKVAAVATVKAAGAGGVDVGAVAIADANVGSATLANTITTVSVTNYGTSTVKSDALTSLSLTNSSAAAASGTLTITNGKATTLDLTVNGGTKGLGAVTAPTYTTLNVHTAGTDTAVAVTAAAATALKIDGPNALNLTGSAFTSLKTVTVSGAAGVTGDFSGGTVTDVNVSASTGNNTVVIDATKATFEGGSGNETVTIAAAPTKAISGGSGADTLVLNVVAATFSNPSANANISGFETLGLGSLANGSYDATGFSALTEGAVAAAVTYTNVAAGAGLTITATPGNATTYTLKDATGTSDSLALTLKASGTGISAGSVTAAGIESVTVNATDSSATAKAGATADSLTLVATSAATVTVTGNTTLTLTSDSTNAKLATVDASGMTGGLSYTAVGTLAQTVKGGATANTLAAHANSTLADTLIGGAGNDQITANAGLDTLTGNGGNDTFVVQVAGASLNVYSTITDVNAGDILNLKDKGVETFTSAKVTLAPTAVFQDYANAVVNAAGDASSNGAIGWFQFNGDTYVVESMHDATATANFTNGTDLIVKLTGLVDLSTATLANIASAPLLAIH